MLALATRVLSPPGPRARLSTFIFHRVLLAPDPLMPDEPDATAFDAMLGWIGSQFRVLDPLEACERLAAGALPARAAAITFDDGYRDNHDVALPLLQKHGMKAAFFIATGFTGGGAMFNDRVIEAVRRCAADALDASDAGLGVLPLADASQRRQAIATLLSAVKHLDPARRAAAVEGIVQAAGADAPADLMMDEPQLRRLAACGMRLGGHTRTHPILRVLDDAAAHREIAGGRDDLQAMTGEPARLFAYPNGRLGDDFEPRHADLARSAGFSFAFTTHAGVSDAGTPAFLLRRFTPWDRTRARFGARSLINLARRAA